MERSRETLVLFALLLALGASTAPAQPIEPVAVNGGGHQLVTKTPALRVVQVDCTRGKSIMKALEKKADELIIEIEGICTEDVEIRRDRVTLRGTDPAQDGIRAATTDEAFSATVFVREARLVRFENLSFQGHTAGTGLRVENARRDISADNCIFAENGFGVVVVGGFLRIDDSEVRDNDVAGLAVGEAGRLTCITCVVADNQTAFGNGTGAVANVGGFLQILNSTISGSMLGVSANTGGTALVSNTDITADEFFGFSSNFGALEVSNATVEGGFFVDDKARMVLAGVNQTFNPESQNTITADSYVVVRDTTASGASTLVGLTALDSFSRAEFLGGTVLGDLTCDSAAEALCGASVTKTSSTCGLCP